MLVLIIYRSIQSNEWRMLKAYLFIDVISFLFVSCRFGPKFYIIEGGYNFNWHGNLAIGHALELMGPY